MPRTLARYRPWFYAAAVYNLVWGAVNIIFPRWMFGLLGVPLNDVPLWQVTAMMVMVYAPAYWWVARRPERFPQFIVIGLLGKVLGPIGFVYAAATRQLPLTFGLTILTNDLIWWPAFFLYLRDAARLHGGWRAMLKGD
jgi:small multidrug resistance pump